jgi:hypothetical protein
MSRTYHATGTGSFTRAGEVRSDRANTRRMNAGQALIKRDAAMFGGTHEHPEGKISYEEAQKIIKNGDKIKTPDGKIHIVTAKNRDELIGRLGADVEKPMAQTNPLMPPQRQIITYRGNLSKPDKVKIDRKVELTNTKKTEQSFGLKNPRLRVSTTQRALKLLPLDGSVRVNPRSKYAPSRNSKKTEMKNSATNRTLRTKQASGSLRPKAIRTARADRLAKKRAENARQREAAKAPATKSVAPKTSRASAPRGTATRATAPRGGSSRGAAPKAPAQKSPAPKAAPKAPSLKAAPKAPAPKSVAPKSSRQGGSKPARGTTKTGPRSVKAPAQKSRKGGRSGRGRSK